MTGKLLKRGSTWLAIGLAGVFSAPLMMGADAAPNGGGNNPGQTPAAGGGGRAPRGGGAGGAGGAAQPGGGGFGGGGAGGAAGGAAGGWGGRGGAGGGVGALFGLGQESETAVPGIFHVIENLVDGWRRNPVDAQHPDQVANFRGNPPTVAITSLIEVDDATADKITKLSEGADSRAKDLVIKYGAKVDKLYRVRIESAKGLLKDDDKVFLDAVLKGWDTCDEATRKITETDATKRADLFKDAREKALEAYLKTMKPEHQARLLKVFANHQAARLPGGLSADTDLCVFWGAMRIEWDEMFKAAEGDAEKLKTFTTDYEKARDEQHDAFKKELQALFNKIRDDVIDGLGNAQDKADLKKMAQWEKDNADKIADITKQMTDLWTNARAQMGGGGGGPGGAGGAGGGAQVDWQALRQQGDDLRKQITDLRDTYGAIWPDRFKEKVPQTQGRGGFGGANNGGGAGGAGGAAPGADQGGAGGNRGRGRGGRGGAGGGGAEGGAAPAPGGAPAAGNGDGGF